MSAPSPSPDAFFPYHCDGCDAPFCERLLILNLALGYEDTQYCMGCLSQRQDQSPPDLLAGIYPYLMSRDCFKTPWQNNPTDRCPKKPMGQCLCEDPVHGP